MTDRANASTRRPHGIRLAVAISLVGLAAACESSVGPIPVADVLLEPTSPDHLVPDGTLQLTASAVDAEGMPLTDRTIEFESSEVEVAEVDPTGFVTARAPGTTTITASSEGQSGAVELVVADGGLVTEEETRIEAFDGAVTITVPAGAAAPGTPMSVQKDDDVPAPAEGFALTGGPAYALGPDGQTFSKPVTVTITYDPASVPTWVNHDKLVFQRWDGTEWHALDDVVVDPDAGTVSGTTTGFSTFSLSIELPLIVLNPAEGSVNETQRQHTFTAGFLGGSVTDDAPFSDDVFWDWSTTGNNGTILETNGPSGTYLATIPVIPEGVIDEVQVVARGLDPDGFPIILGIAFGQVDGELREVYQLLPISTELDFDQSAPLEARVTNGPGEYNYEWSTTGNHGDLRANDEPIQMGVRTSASSVRYHAKSAEESTALPPRVDRIDVKFWRRAPGTTQWEMVGEAEAFMSVAGQKVQGSWGIEVDANCAGAFIYVPKVPEATSYQMHAYGFNDTEFYGTEIRRTWSGAIGSTVVDDGDQWKLPLSGACGATPEDAVPWLEGRFNGMVVDVVVTGGS